MTNAQAATHFAQLPPDEQASILLINTDTGSSEKLYLQEPGTDLNEVTFNDLDPGDEALLTVTISW